MTPMKGVIKFDKKGLLSPRYIDLFDIMQTIGNIGNRLALPHMKASRCIPCIMVGKVYG